MTAQLETVMQIAPNGGHADAVAAQNGVHFTSRPLRWSDEEYARLTQAGFFDERRVELIEGELVEMGAMQDLHWAAMFRAPEVMRRAFGFTFGIQTQCPLRLAPGVQPEPDLAVFAADPVTFRGAALTSALLVVEVSDSTLAYDQGRKKSLYARYAVPELWILNLIDNQLEVSREPIESPSSTFGWNFKTTTIYRAGESVSPAFAPDVSVAVADLLPLD